MANTKASLTQQNTQTYPSNTSGSITANAVKSFNNNFINAVATLGDTNVFTQPQTFGDVVQVNSNVIANNFVGNLIGTASVALTALTASYLSGSITNAVSASYATEAANAILFDGKARSTFATTGSNTFNGTNTFSGSVNIQSASIQFLTVDTIVSSSTIFSTGSNTLGDASNDVQTLWGTVNLPTGPLKVTGSVGSTGGFTGSLQGTASFADNSTSASFALTASFAQNAGVPTGSFATTGSNVFSGSQTFNTASLILNSSGSNPLFSNFTQSVSGTGAYGNILMFLTSAQSGSFILSGSRNVGTINPLINASALTNRGGGNLNGNFGLLAPSYTTASAPPVLSNNFLLSGVNSQIPNTSSVTTLNGNFVGGAITITGSATANVSVTTNNIDGVVINNNWTGSGASQQVTVNNNLLKSPGGTGASLIDFGGATTNANSRQFNQNLVFGIANTASLVVNGLATVSNLLNTSIIGSNLIVSGTMNQSSLSASMFVGQFNETGSVADASLVKFAVGSGTTNAARKTPFYVSQSGDVVIRANGDGQGLTQFSPNRIARVADGNLNGSVSTVAAANAVFNTNAVTNNGVQLCSIISTDVSTLTTAANSVMIAASTATMLGGSTNMLSGYLNNMTASNFSTILGGQSNTMSSSLNSTILGGSNIRMNASTASVALGRDTAYTASANYTLFTQNIQASGSVGVTGSVNATSFTGSLLGTASYATQALTASYAQNATPTFPYTGIAQVSGTLAFTGSLLGYIDANNSLVVNFGDNTVTNPGNNGRNFTFGTTITNASANNGAAFGESHNVQNPSYNSFIGGGNGNTMNANKAFMGGGTSNQVTAVEGAVIGGSSNSVSHQASVVLGGSGISSTQTNEVSVPHLRVTGSATINDVLVLPFQSPLPSGKPTGSLALSGSGATYVGMFVYDGTNWVSA